MEDVEDRSFNAPSIHNPNSSLSEVLDFEVDLHDKRSVTRPSVATALLLGAVTSCVKAIAEPLAYCDIHIKRKEGNIFVRDEDHYLNRLFQDVSDDFTLQGVLESGIGNAALSGNGLNVIYRNRRTGLIEAIETRPIEEFSIYRTEQRTKLWYYVSDNYGGSQVLAPHEVLHIRGFSLDGLMGMSPISHARYSISMGLSALEYSNDNFSSGGFGGGIIQTEQPMDPNSRLKYARQVRKAQALGIPPVLDRGMTYTTNQISPKDIDFINQMKWTSKDIASQYRVPPHKLGLDTNITGSNLEHMDASFVNECLRIWSRRVETEMEKKFLTGEEKHTHMIKFDLTSLIRGSHSSMAEFYSQMLTNQVMVPNEVLRDIGLEARPGGDVPVNHQESAKGTPGGPNIHTINKNSGHEEE